MTANDVREKMDAMWPNHGLQTADVEETLDNLPESLIGKSEEEVARHILATHVWNALNIVRPNHGLRVYDVVYFLRNSANCAVIAEMSAEEAARYYCSVTLDVAGTY